MRAYIRHTKNRTFYAGWGQWSDDFRRAISFETIPAAMAKVSEEHLKSVEVVLVERSTGLQIIFPAQAGAQPLIQPTQKNPPRA